MEEIIPETPEAVEVDESVEEKKPSLPMWVKIVFIVFGLGIVALYLFMSGWGGYAYSYVTCGIKQPLIASTAETGRAYYLPDHRRYSAPGEGVFFGGYYCTEAQARDAGFLKAGP